MLSRAKNPNIERISRALLAGTCLTMAYGPAAQAQKITEGTAPAPADFGGGFATAYQLPIETNEVVGSVNDRRDAEDFFYFSGLNSSISYTLGLVRGSAGHGEENLQAYAGYSAGFEGLPVLNFTQEVGSTGTMTPGGEGKLTVAVQITGLTGGENVPLRTSTYDVTLNAVTSTPEPGTMALGAAALSTGAVAWRRRRKRVS